MQSTSCPVCFQYFTRSDAMKRHLRTIHKMTRSNSKINDPYPQSNEVNPPPSPPPPHYSEPNGEKKAFKFQHPFTMIVAGPTLSGKTTWVKTLLLNRNHVITPPPERIVWIYKRWQPLYDELRFRIPQIQFIHNLPSEMNDDAFFYIKERTFVIIDDMMKDATESKDVCEIFIEDAHHCNISVACIMQNLFNRGKGNRTMNINTQYFIVFKNPRDKLQIASLAKQMFPGNSRKLLDAYERAVEKPHGSLLIDFKQSTPEIQRLQSNVLNDKSHPTVVLDSKRDFADNDSCIHSNTHVISSYETDSGVDDTLEECDDDTSAFDRWINEIWEKRNPEIQTKVSELIGTRTSEDAAGDHVKQQMMETDRELLLDTYSAFLRGSCSLMNCILHTKIRHSLLCQVNLNGMSIEDVITQVLRDYKNDFDVLFNEDL